jgi:competence protein ComEC
MVSGVAHPRAQRNAPRAIARTARNVRRAGHDVPGWLARSFIAEHDRWPLWLPVLVGAGIILYFNLPREPAFFLGPGLTALFGLGALILRRRWSVPALACLALGATALGFAAAQVRTALVAAPVLASPIGPIEVTGTIVSSELGEPSVRVVLEAPIVPGLSAEATPARIRLRLIKGESSAASDHQALLLPGARLAVRAMLRPPPEPIEPGAFDFARQAYFERIGASGFAVGRYRIIEPAAPALWRGWLERQRERLSQRLLAGSSAASGGLAPAFLTGDQSAVPKPVMRAMQDSGLAHLVAISGLNFALAAGFFFFVIRFGLALIPALALRFPIKKWAAAGALIGSFGYLLISGAGVPTERSFIMIGLVLFAIMIDRTGLSLRLLGVAALAVLLLEPESVLGASFQMSFIATLFLIAGFEAVRRPLARLASNTPLWFRPAFYLLSVALSSLLAGVATGPFTLYHFDRFAAYGLAANMLAVPLAGFWVMPFGLIALLLAPFGAESLALTPMSWGLEAILWVARTTAALPGAVMLSPAMPALALGLMALGGLWLCLWRGRWRILGLAPALVCLALTVTAERPDLLVDGDAKLVAVRAEDGMLWLSSTRKARFVAQTWLKRNGQDQPIAHASSAPNDTWLAEQRDDTAGALPSYVDGAPRCDALGCVTRLKGRTVALIFDPRALAEECQAAEIIIAFVPVRGACPSALMLIDRYALWREGTHALWLGEDGALAVQTVAQTRGERPWVVARSRHRSRRADVN